MKTFPALKSSLLLVLLFNLIFHSSMMAQWVLGGNSVGATGVIGTTTAFDFSIRTNTSEKMRITSAGNVGIGTASPAAKLDLVGGNMNLNNNNIDLRNDGNHCLGWYGTGKTYATAAIDGPVLFGYNGGALGFSNGSQNIVLRWNNSGNIGIGHGNNTLNAKLDVNGTIRTGSIIYLASGTDANHGIGYNALSVFSPNGPVLFGYGGGALGSKVSSTEKIALMWDNNGQVGIGTTAPAARLEVKSDGAYSNGFLVSSDSDLAKTIAVSKSGTINFMVYGNGKVYAREITVQLGTFPDYVFSKDYKLTSIDDLSDYIKKYNHLPNIPSAEEVKSNNIGLGELQLKLLEKIEEMSLYIVELNERIKTIEAENFELKNAERR